jgi:hypothetical protein
MKEITLDNIPNEWHKGNNHIDAVLLVKIYNDLEIENDTNIEELSIQIITEIK